MPTNSDFDYEAEATMVVAEPQQLRALADEVRTRIIHLLRDRARSTQELSKELGIPKGTAGHHVKVLEQAGLIRVVRTRPVRGVTEKFYGRTARLFLFQTEDPADERAIGANVLRQAAGEIDRESDRAGFGLVRARLTDKDFVRLERRMKRLLDDFTAADEAGGMRASFALAWWTEERRDA